MVQNQNIFLDEKKKHCANRSWADYLQSSQSLWKEIYYAGFYYASGFQRNKLHASFAVLILQVTTAAVVHSLRNIFYTVPIKQEVGMLARGFQHLNKRSIWLPTSQSLFSNGLYSQHWVQAQFLLWEFNIYSSEWEQVLSKELYYYLGDSLKYL